MGEQEKRAKTPRKEDLDSHQKRAKTPRKEDKDPNSKEKGKDPDHILKKRKKED